MLIVYKSIGIQWNEYLWNDRLCEPSLSLLLTRYSGDFVPFISHDRFVLFTISQAKRQPWSICVKQSGESDSSLWFPTESDQLFIFYPINYIYIVIYHCYYLIKYHSVYYNYHCDSLGYEPKLICFNLVRILLFYRGHSFDQTIPFFIDHQIINRSPIAFFSLKNHFFFNNLLQ